MRLPWTVGVTEGVCKTCLAVKPVVEFSRVYGGTDYYRKTCRSCWVKKSNTRQRSKTIEAKGRIVTDYRPCSLCQKPTSSLHSVYCNECRMNGRPCPICEVQTPIRKLRNGCCNKCHSTSRAAKRDGWKKENKCRECGSDRAVGSSLCLPCLEVWNKSHHGKRKDIKQRCVDYKGCACIDCGLKTEMICVYDFHHRDPALKEFTIMVNSHREWSRITAELDKCDLVCANCHRIRHHQMREEKNQKRGG